MPSPAQNSAWAAWRRVHRSLETAALMLHLPEDGHEAQKDERAGINPAQTNKLPF
jgi:hypothetical protein